MASSKVAEAAKKGANEVQILADLATFQSLLNDLSSRWIEIYCFGSDFYHLWKHNLVKNLNLEWWRYFGVPEKIIKKKN